MQFRNPANSYEESVTNWSMLFALVLGIFYFAYKGLWRHVFTQAILIAASAALFGPAAPIVLVGAWLIYALMARASCVPTTNERD